MARTRCTCPPGCGLRPWRRWCNDPAMVSLEQIQLAQKRLRGIAARTPLICYFPPAHRQSAPADAKSADEPTRGHLWLKAESLQPIGSFKLRGAYNKIASFTEQERQRGVISYSSGNHAQGVAYAARALGVKAIIVMPRNAPKIKMDSTAALGAEIVTVGPASAKRLQKAEELARQYGYMIVPPYNDEQIIAGQGDRKSTRLNSSHLGISYAVFCLK